MQTPLRVLAKGMISYLPGTDRWFCSTSGGTESARYCYTVWMRHFIKAYESGFDVQWNSVAELGPGDSLGIGLCAVLAGANNYFAFDTKQHAHNKRNCSILDELVDMFLRFEKIPDDEEFPNVSPKLLDYTFPSHILTKSVMARNLHPDRLIAVSNQLLNLESCGNVHISYVAPWNSASILQAQIGHIDMIFSQAVMEHVEDVDGTYRDLYEWLRPGGFMSHTIDYKSHEITRDWNGHWTVSDFEWKLVKGNRPYLINRLPHSAHILAMTRSGFRIVLDAARKTGNTIRRNQLAPKFQNLTDDDLSTAGAFIQATKPLI